MLTIAISFSKFSLKKLTSKEYLEFKKQLQLPIDSDRDYNIIHFSITASADDLKSTQHSFEMLAYKRV